jgi:hypothetical protein
VAVDASNGFAVLRDIIAFIEAAAEVVILNVVDSDRAVGLECAISTAASGIAGAVRTVTIQINKKVVAYPSKMFRQMRMCDGVVRPTNTTISSSRCCSGV